MTAEAQQPQQQPQEEASIVYRWLHKRDKVRFNRPDLWLIFGIRGSGKSSFLERVAEQYLFEGAGIVDMFGSADSEGLAWLRSPYRDKQILLLRGDSVVVKSEYDCKLASELTQQDLREYDLIINASALYGSRDEEYMGAERISNVLYNRSRHRHDRLLCTLVRESASFFYAKLKMSGSQQDAKSSMMYMLREARHNYIAMVSDALYVQAVEKELRMSVDYTVIKAVGMMRLPEHLSWLYNPVYSKVMYTHYQSLAPKEFFLVTKAGALAYGQFDAVPWHKDEKEHIVSKVGIEVEYLSPTNAPPKLQGLDDKTHAEIVKCIADGMSLRKTSAFLSVSKQSVSNHVNAHNQDVAAHGVCPTCSRVSGEYAKLYVKRGETSSPEFAPTI